MKRILLLLLLTIIPVRAHAADLWIANTAGGTIRPIDKPGPGYYTIRLPDTDGSHFATFIVDPLSAAREIHFDASAGNITLGGTNTGDQTIALTGDVTGSGTGTFATTIANDVIDFADMADSMTLDANLAIGSSVSNFSVDIDSGVLFIDTANNRVGVGTITPAVRLHVEPTSAGAIGLVVRGKASQTANLQEWQNSSAAKLVVIDASGLLGLGDSTPDASVEIVNDGVGDSLLIADTNDADATPFVIQSDGDVGIGTGSPNVKLDVRGDMHVNNGQFTFVNTILDTGSGGILRFGQGASAQIYVTSDILRLGDVSGSAPTVAVELWSNDAMRLRVDTTGNIGIGTTTPSNLLHVSSAVSGNSTLKFTYEDTLVALNDIYGQILFEGTDVGTSAAGVRAQIQAISEGANGEAGLSFSSKASGASAMTEGLRITGAGFLGLGTSSPLRQLHFKSHSAALHPHIRIEDVDTAISIGEICGGIEFWANDSSALAAGGRAKIVAIGEGGIGATGLAFHTSDDGGTADLTDDESVEVLRISNLGSVGIGTTSPTQKLHLKLTQNDGISLENISSPNSFWRIGIDINSGLLLREANGDKYVLTMAVAGNVGVLDTTPDASLDITNDGVGDSFLVADTNDGDATPFVIQSDGDVGIKIAGPLQALDIEGNLRIRGVSPTTRIEAQVAAATYRDVFSVSTANSLLSIGDSSIYTGIGFYPGIGQAALLTNSGNLGLGQTTFGTSATKTLAISSGTAPSTSPADAFQMYSADIAAGEASPHFRTEDGDIIKLFQSAANADTAGATLGNLETEVNQLKTLLRDHGFLAP